MANFPRSCNLASLVEGSGFEVGPVLFKLVAPGVVVLHSGGESTEVLDTELFYVLGSIPRVFKLCGRMLLRPKFV
jgi:hypothetical protein